MTSPTAWQRYLTQQFRRLSLPQRQAMRAIFDHGELEKHRDLWIANVKSTKPNISRWSAIKALSTRGYIGIIIDIDRPGRRFAQLTKAGLETMEAVTLVRETEAAAAIEMRASL